MMKYEITTNVSPPQYPIRIKKFGEETIRPQSKATHQKESLSEAIFVH